MGWLWTFNLVTMALLFVAALRWGAGPERICAATVVAMNLGDRAYHLLIGSDTIYDTVDTGHLILDLAAAALFIGVALQANRIYPLWLSAFQLVSIVAHFVRRVDEQLTILAYGLLNYAPYYFILLILTGGIWAHARRAKRYGPYRSWRSDPARSVPFPEPTPTDRPI